MLYHFAAVPLQQTHYFFYIVVVFLYGYASHAAAATLAYMEFEAGAEAAAHNAVGTDLQLAVTQRVEP